MSVGLLHKPAWSLSCRIVRLDRAAMARLTPAESMRPELWPVVSTVEIEAGATVQVKLP